jgi:hypothetical protein
MRRALRRQGKILERQIKQARWAVSGCTVLAVPLQQIRRLKWSGLLVQPS